MGSQPVSLPCLTPPLHPSILLPPALVSLPWLIPFRPLSPLLTPLSPLAPRLCVALAQRGRRRHTDGHADGHWAMQGCLPTPAPCWHRARARRPHCAHAHSLTLKHRCASDAELSLSIYWTFPHIDLQGICTCKYSHEWLYMLMHLHVTSFFFFFKKRFLPPTLCCSACHSQMFTRLSPTVPQHVLSRHFFVHIR